jgi:hypothetical protein
MARLGRDTLDRGNTGGDWAPRPPSSRGALRLRDGLTVWSDL